MSHPEPKRLPRSDRVLLLVDFINPLSFPGARELAPAAVAASRAARRLRRRLDAEAVPVIYANDNFGRWHSEFQQQVASLAKQAGAAGTIARVLRPRHRDLTILKPRHSAFFASPLDVLLKEMGARQIIIAGLATDMCVQLTAMDGFLRGYKLWVPADCTAAESAEAKAASLAYMASILECDVSEAAA